MSGLEGNPQAVSDPHATALFKDSTPVSTPAERAARFVWTACLVALALIGIAAAGGVLVPFPFLRSKLFALSRTGNLEFFNEQIYQAIRARLLIVSLCYGASLAAGVALRRRMIAMLTRCIRDFRTLREEAIFSLRSLSLSEGLLILFFVGFAMFLRIPLLFQPMRFDEGTTFTWYASRPLYVALSSYTSPNNHLLHTLLVHASYVLFGNQPWALRLPAFVSGIGIIPASYGVARALYDRQTAIMAAALAVISAPLIEYSGNARGYSMVCVIFLMCLISAAYQAQHDSASGWALLAILVTLGFYTIPIMLYPAGGIAVWLVLLSWSESSVLGPRRMLRRTAEFGIATALGTAVLYTPVLAVSGPRALFANRFVVPRSIVGEPLIASLSGTWEMWTDQLPVLLYVVLTIGFAIGVLWQSQIGRFRVSVPIGLVLFIVPALFLQRVVPFERVWLFALPIVFIVSAAGLTFLAARVSLPRLQLAASVCAISLVLYCGFSVRSAGPAYASNEGRGIEPIAEYLKGQLQPGDSVMAGYVGGSVDYYFQKHGVPVAYLNAPVAHRVFLVVSRITNETPSSILHSGGIDRKLPESPRLRATFDVASVYEVEIQK